jgi:hypothetical protein
VKTRLTTNEILIRLRNVEFYSREQSDNEHRENYLRSVEKNDDWSALAARIERFYFPTANYEI